MPKTYLLFKEINLISPKRLESDETFYPPIHLQLELRTESIKLLSNETGSCFFSIKWNMLYDFDSKRVN